MAYLASDWIQRRPGQKPMVRRNLFPEDAYAATFRTSRWTIWGPEIAAGSIGHGFLRAPGCVALHALAIHGSGCGRWVNVLESWTLGSMRRLHNKSLQLTPKRPCGTVEAAWQFYMTLG